MRSAAALGVFFFSARFVRGKGRFPSALGRAAHGVVVKIAWKFFYHAIWNSKLYFIGNFDACACKFDHVDKNEPAS